MREIQVFLTNSSEVSESNRLSNEERGAESHSDSGDKCRVLENKPKFDKLTIDENSFEISMKMIYFIMELLILEMSLKFQTNILNNEIVIFVRSG